MDKDLKKIVNETVQEFFQEAPEQLVERGIREMYYDVCPHCKQEIMEKHEYTEDGGTTWRHSECKGLISRPETPLEQLSDGLKPYVKEARQMRKLARKQMGIDENVVGLPPSGEEKYSKQEPGGTMSAVNSTSLANENVEQSSETQVLSPGRDSKFFGGECRFHNTTKMRLKVTAHKFLARIGEVHQSAYYFRVEDEP